jgi:hypothetical protein
VEVLRGTTVAFAPLRTCRETRDPAPADAGGDGWTDERWVLEAYGVSLSIIPNSFVIGSGEGSVECEDVPLVALFARRDVVDPLKAGEEPVDIRLEIRGIFVGVSFVKLEDTG